MRSSVSPARATLIACVVGLGVALAATYAGGVDKFTDRLRDGMRQTLERIKAEAEA